MNRMVLHSRVGADGVLHITVPMDKGDAGREVQVTIDPVGPPPMMQEEWRNFVLSTAGSITDPSFVRHEQGQYEHREANPPVRRAQTGSVTLLWGRMKSTPKVGEEP
jgi:hypothetical protein